MGPLPAADPEAITTIKNDTTVQVIDVLDIQTPLSVQIERLEARRQNLELLPDEEPEEPRGTRMCKYTVRDSDNNALFLIYLNTPPVLPTLGSVLTVRAGCDLHRGILIATPQTVVVTGTSGQIPGDRIERLRSLLPSKSDRSTS